MSIRYYGINDIKIKINRLIDEMLEDKNLIYTINIYEDRTNEKIKELKIEITDIEYKEE